MSSYTWSPVGGSSSGNGVNSYANVGAFPNAITSGNGALAIALDTDILYISNGSAWVILAEGPLTIGTFGASPTANGATASGSTLTLQPADATRPGAVSITAQTFKGAKTFSDGIIGNLTGAASDNILTSAKAQANGVASLDSNALIPINQLPPAALERIVIVADQAARFALTTATVQNGDTVLQVDIDEMFFVKDDTNLGNSSGYQVYAAGTAVVANTVPTTAVSNSATYYPAFFASSSNSNQALNLATNFTFNPNTGMLGAVDATFSAITGNNIISSTTLSTALAQLDLAVTQMDMSGFESWAASGPYWSVSGADFTLLVGGVGWIHSKKITWAGGQTVSIPVNTCQLVYIDSSGLIQATDASVCLQDGFEDLIPLFLVLNDGTNILVSKENHDYDFGSDQVHFFHATIGTIFVDSAAVLTRVTTGTGGVVTDREIKTVGADAIADGELETVIPDSGGSAISMNFKYLDGVGNWTFYASQAAFPMVYNNAGTPTALATTGAGHVGVFTLYVTRDNLNTSTPLYIAVMNNTSYANTGAANTAITNGNVQAATNELFKLQMAQCGYIIVENNASGGIVSQIVTSKSRFGSAVSALGNVNQAALITLDTSTFTNVLSASDTTVQIALNTLDAALTGNVARASNLVGGNNSTLLGSIPYQSDTDTTTLLSPNTTTTKKFLIQTGDGANGAAPAWDTLASSDIPNNAADTTGTASKATNLKGGNSTTLLGSIPYQSDTDTTTLLSPNVTKQKMSLQQFGDGTNGAAPVWEPNASQSLGKNYIANNLATVAATGWATYADAAQATPENGTGGSPTVTFARNTSSPLRGAADFLFTHDAADRQGEGFSYDFTIDSADQGKVLQGSFEYKIASGTYADDDLAVWIYDVTNAALIQPAPYLIKNSGIIERFPFEFQSSSSSTSYRLIVHVTTATATAYTIQFDNFAVGPTAKLYGSPVMDWQSYTPACSWVSGVGTILGRWRRVGDSIDIEAEVPVTGAVTAANLSIELPSGKRIDSAKMASGAPYEGGVVIVSAGNSSIGYAGVVPGSSTTTIYILTSTSAVTDTNPGTFTNGDVVRIKASGIPILGWSSSVVMSSDADTRVVAARAYLASGTTVTVDATTQLALNGVSYDTHGAFNTSNKNYVVPVAGIYRVAAVVSFGTDPASAPNIFVLRKNGAAYSTLMRHDTASKAYFQGAAEVQCNAGDTLDFTYYIASTGTPTFTAGATATWATFSRISGPAQVAASEKVYFSVNDSNTAAATSAPFKFTTIQSNSHGAYSSSTGVFTAPRAGFYTFGYSVYVGGAANINLYKNGSNVYQGATPGAAGNPGGGSYGAYLNAGDTIEIRPGNNQTATSSATLDTFWGVSN